MGIHYEHFDHEADIGLRGCGSSLAEAFTAVALALTAVITDPDSVSSKITINIEIPPADTELQLYDYINAIIFNMSSRKMLFGAYQVQFEGGWLLATASGEPVDNEKHDPAVEVKGATMTELAVYSRQGEWCAQCIVDV